MIVVTIELRSARTKKRKVLGSMLISNVGAGSANRFSYFYRLFKQRGEGRGEPFADGTVEDYPRDAYHAWELVRRILEHANEKSKIR